MAHAPDAVAAMSQGAGRWNAPEMEEGRSATGPLTAG